MPIPFPLPRRVKDFVKRRPRLYRLALAAYERTNPSRIAANRFRLQCAKRFREDPVLTITVGGQKCRYHAISAKNYWHLATSNNETHPYFGQYLLPGDVVLDIGGHVGAWTIPYSKYVGAKGRVYVFEPDPTGYEAIRRNVALNDCTNVTAFNCAIAGEDGRTKFFLRPDKDTHSVFQTTSAPSPSGVQVEIETEVRTIDSLLKSGMIPQPNFIKLDIEGAELLALEGMRHALLRARAIYVECHDVLRTEQDLGDPVQAVSRKLNDLGIRNVIKTDEAHVLGIVESAHS